MKYIVLIADGMEDLPNEQLAGKTPLEVAKIPNMNRLAAEGQVGLAWTIPPGFEPASDVANLSILGYDPKEYYMGRGPLEAANMGISLKEDEVAFRCNFVTVSEDKLEDYSAGHISDTEADVLIEALNKKLGCDEIRFYRGLTYRHLVILKANTKRIPFSTADLVKIPCYPPHNIMGESIRDHMPKGNAGAVLTRLMDASREILRDHEVNKVRIDLKENPANMICCGGRGYFTG